MKSRKKKMIAPIVITVLMVLYYIVYFGFLVVIIPGVFKIVFGILPIVFSAVMVHVCIERIKEIKDGEENDISKY